MCFCSDHLSLFFSGIPCFHLVPVCFAGPVFYSSSLRFFCRLSRFLSRVVLSSFLEGRSGLGLLSSVLRWGLWTLLLALGRFVLLSLPGPLAVQLRFHSACGSDRTLEFPHCEEVSGGPQVVLFLGLSAGAAAPCLFHAGACGLSLCGLLGEVFCSVFLSSTCGFLFMAFFKQLAVTGVLFVVFSTGCCLNVLVLCSSSLLLSFLLLRMYAGGLVVLSL